MKPRSSNRSPGRVRGCDDRLTDLGEGLWAGPGFMTPVVRAFEELIASDPTAVWNQAANEGRGCATTSGSSSPRIRPIGLFDTRSGPGGPASSSDAFPVADWIGVFVEDGRAVPAPQSFVSACFIEFMGVQPAAPSGANGSLSKILQSWSE